MKHEKVSKSCQEIDIVMIFQIEVIKGSGVFCQAEAWKAARLATSATANLLLGTFNLETLLKSNLNCTKQYS